VLVGKLSTTWGSWRGLSVPVVEFSELSYSLCNRNQKGMCTLSKGNIFALQINLMFLRKTEIVCILNATPILP
jgi:hypothetical protein